MTEETPVLSPVKPYLIRALISWCEDNGLTPYVVTQVDDEADVPLEFVNNGKITLSVAEEAIHNPDFGNEAFTFSARFGEQARGITLPVRAIVAVFPAELPEHGIGFPYEAPQSGGQQTAPEQENQKAAAIKKRPAIQKVK